MKIWLVIILLLFLLISCNKQSEEKAFPTYGVAPKEINGELADVYFPYKMFESTDLIDSYILLDSAYLDSSAVPVEVTRDTSYYKTSIDSFQVRWHSDDLYQLKEPILYKDTTDIEVIRFLLNKSWKPQIIISLIRDGENYFMRYKQLNKPYSAMVQIDYETKKVIPDTVRYYIKVDKTLPIKPEQFKEVMACLKEFDFKNQPTVESQIGFDGSRWNLEVKTKDYYKVINRWSPHRGGPDSGPDYKFAQCCLKILALTEFKNIF